MAKKILLYLPVLALIGYYTWVNVSIWYLMLQTLRSLP